MADASAAAPAAARHGLKTADAVIALPILVEEERLDDRMDPEALAAQIATAQAARLRVTTSRPSRRAFAEAFQQCRARGFEAVVTVTLSGALSGTVEAARSAAEEAEIPVAVVDSRAAGWAAARCVDAVLREAESGRLDGLCSAAPGLARSTEAERASSAAERSLAHWRCAATLPNLAALRAGGRAPAAAAGLVKALSLRPVLPFGDGGFSSVDMAMTPAGAVEKALRHIGLDRKSTATRPGAGAKTGAAMRSGADARAGAAARAGEAERPADESSGAEPGAGVDREREIVVETFAVPHAAAERQLREAGFEGSLVFSPLPLVLAVHLGPGAMALSSWGEPEQAS